MSHPFKELRKQAKESRELAYERARQEYQRTMDAIQALEASMVKQSRKRYRNVGEAIDSVIPFKGSFTADDILAGLKKLDDSRYWRKRSVLNRIVRLRNKGLVKRLRRSHGTEQAVYTRAGSGESIPFEDMTMLEVIRQVLDEIVAEVGPVRVADLAICMRERGFHTTMNQKQLCKGVSQALTGNPDLFVEKGGKWGLVG